MTRMLVTGGTGVLGRAVVARLQRAGEIVRVMSRRAESCDDVEWAQADAKTGAGLADAVREVNTVVHCLSNPVRDTEMVDVAGTAKLLEHARAACVAHFVFISIVGIERIPLEYYKSKLAAERVVENGDVPWTILRATQFHDLLDGRLQRSMRFPLALIPTDLQFQPIDAGECADRLVELARGRAAGRVADIGGPQVLRFGEMARAWLNARGKSTRIIHLPLPGQVWAGYRNGYNTTPQNCYGKITWNEWLKQKYE